VFSVGLEAGEFGKEFGFRAVFEPVAEASAYSFAIISRSSAMCCLIRAIFSGQVSNPL
jgi:hypothetical protein